MTDSLKSPLKQDYLGPNCLAQLTDDTAIFAGGIEALKEKLIKLFGYSNNNYQVISTEKTKYVHLSTKPYREPITINENVSVGSVDKDGYKYLDVIVINSKKIVDHSKEH